MVTPAAGEPVLPRGSPLNVPQPGDAPWRLFVAIDVPGAFRAALAVAQTRMPLGLDRAVRWAPPAGVHLTLRFLGDVDPGGVDALREPLTDAARRSARFMLKLGDPGAFPSLRRPRVLWLGIGGEMERLKRLHGRIEGGLSRAGFEPDDRPLTPHLTAGRVRAGVPPRDLAALGGAFAALPLPSPSPEFEVDEVVLFRSHLTPAGARYERVHAAPLG
jgi:2'-5' RNA ligase